MFILDADSPGFFSSFLDGQQQLHVEDEDEGIRQEVEEGAAHVELVDCQIQPGIVRPIRALVRDWLKTVMAGFRLVGRVMRRWNAIR